MNGNVFENIVLKFFGLFSIRFYLNLQTNKQNLSFLFSSTDTSETKNFREHHVKVISTSEYLKTPRLAFNNKMRKQDILVKIIFPFFHKISLEISKGKSFS